MVVALSIAGSDSIGGAGIQADIKAMGSVGVHAATDVTGFGLLGHLRELLAATGLAARIAAAAVPLLPKALELAAAGHIPGGTRRNRDDVAASVHWHETISEPLRILLCDAQTSGGLLLAVAPDRVDSLVQELERRATPAAAVVGEIEAGPAGFIEVMP